MREHRWFCKMQIFLFLIEREYKYDLWLHITLFKTGKYRFRRFDKRRKAVCYHPEWNADKIITSYLSYVFSLVLKLIRVSEYLTDEYMFHKYFVCPDIFAEILSVNFEVWEPNM